MARLPNSPAKRTIARRRERKAVRRAAREDELRGPRRIDRRDIAGDGQTCRDGLPRRAALRASAAGGTPRSPRTARPLRAGPVVRRAPPAASAAASSSSSGCRSSAGTGDHVRAVLVEQRGPLGIRRAVVLVRHDDHDQDRRPVAGTPCCSRRPRLVDHARRTAPELLLEARSRSCRGREAAELAAELLDRVGIGVPRCAAGTATPRSKHDERNAVAFRHRPARSRKHRRRRPRMPQVDIG